MSLFIFDMGEVILLGVRTLKQLSEYVGTDYHDIRTDYAYYDRALMDGYMSAEDYYHHLEDKYQCRITEDLFVKFFHPAVNTAMLSRIDMLRARGHRCVIGSNTFRPHWDHVKTFSEKPLDHFDALYASHIMHMSKPEKAFWRIICQSEGYDYKDTCFIDDLPENIEAAASLGISTLKYSGDDKEERAEEFFSRFL